MSADELIHLISNQALNKVMKEQNKLVIQDCCKELFNKKETIKNKYKKIHFVENKAKIDDDELYIKSKVMSRIVEICDCHASECNFPDTMSISELENFNEGEVVVRHIMGRLSFTILKVEDI